MFSRSHIHARRRSKALFPVVFENPGSCPRTILLSGFRPSLGINKNTLMAPVEVQLTWAEAWATGWKTAEVIFWTPGLRATI